MKKLIILFLFGLSLNSFSQSNWDITIRKATLDSLKARIDSVYMQSPFTGDFMRLDTIYANTYVGAAEVAGSKYEIQYNNGGVLGASSNFTWNDTTLGIESSLGTNNIFIGEESGVSNLGGTRNLFLGYNSGSSSTTGSYNTFMGYLTGLSNVSGDSSVFIGYRAGENETTSQKLYIENSNSSTPLIYGEFDNDLININGTLSVKSATNTSGDFNITGSNTEPTQGAEQVTNGDFTTDLTGWTNGGNWSQSSGTALHTAGSTATLSQDVSVTATNFYLLEFDITGSTAGTLTASLGGVTADALSDDVTDYAIMIEASSTADLTFTPTSDFDGAIDNVSVTQFTASNPVQTIYDDADNAIIETRVSGDPDFPNMYLGLNAGQFSRGALYPKNAGFGTLALSSITDGVNNVGMGSQAGKNLTTGSNNVIVGNDALFNNKIGDYNIAIGVSAGQNCILGERNVFIGRQAGRSSDSYNVMIGYQAGRNETGSNKLYIENSNSAAPLIYGEFDNDSVVINGALNVTGSASYESHTGLFGRVTPYDITSADTWITAKMDTVYQNTTSSGFEFNSDSTGIICRFGGVIDFSGHAILLNNSAGSVNSGTYFRMLVNSVEQSQFNTSRYRNYAAGGSDDLISLTGGVFVSENDTISVQVQVTNTNIDLEVPDGGLFDNSYPFTLYLEEVKCKK